MRVRIGVGLAAAVLLFLGALSASAAKSGDDDQGDEQGGNAWGTHLAEMKSADGASVGNGNGHAWGLMLADIKGKGPQSERADLEDDDEGGGHGIASGSLHVGKGELEDLDEHEHGEDHGPPVVTPHVVTPPLAPSEVSAVPEPSAALLFAAGTGFVLLSLRRRLR